MTTVKKTIKYPIQRANHKVDLAGKSVGRVASQIAVWLMGKHKRTYVPHVDNGDFVQAIHVKDIKFTGNKLNQKVYYKHSGYVGNLKETSAKKMLAEKPDRVLFMAVRRMLADNKLRTPRLKRLTIS